ncbi:heterokaryon incompatibility protein-domain-containing protein [Dendryphion nanum]|uniref:Heterokaryon incompatibility protein-domain-containing protein n=1 Tax=Dendryphion nanum TaxID=256645 RepID=A0A9P9DYK2_9PLEO|nr:heterokaryon incompatibility protein-domain-containing protein [Dendryphion nanum]
MSALEPLCDYCVKVDLRPERPSKQLPRKDKWSLGPGSRIKNSRCPMCRLVRHVFYEVERTELDMLHARLSERTDVILEWFQASGPGGRGAFYVHNTSEHWICFTGKSDTHSLAAGHYYLQPKLRSELEVSRVSRWLSTCTSKHAIDCNAEGPMTFEDAFPGLQVLRFIDVKRNCLVETQSICQYVALSYVWGAVPNFRLTKANKRELSVPGGIETVWKMIPRTIRDAIEFTRMLGRCYLCVDALCLLQNNREDLELGVAVMDQVYERSWLTIIAACGHDANAGLPGVREGSRKFSNLTLDVKRDISLGVYTGLDLLYRHSVHNSRAWTFQEHLLPRRAVYFVDNKIFFRCREAEYTECCLDHPQPCGPGVTRTSLLPPTVYMSEPLIDFAIMLLYYTRRALTNQDDVLRAMEGTIRRFSEKIKCRFLEGLPTAALDAFITFQSSNWTGLHRRTRFPSYSWVGWKGAITISTQNINNDWLRMKTWIIWHKRSLSGITNLVWDPAANELFPTVNPEYIGYRERQPFRSLPALGIITSRTTPTEDLTFDMARFTYPLLQFWTLALFYKIGNIDVFKAHGDILAEGGTVCGQMWLDGFEETTFFESEGMFEVILLSECVPDLYNVMLLEWNAGVAERRGIGTIKLSAIDKSFPPGPVWKEIILA